MALEGRGHRRQGQLRTSDLKRALSRIRNRKENSFVLVDRQHLFALILRNFLMRKQFVYYATNILIVNVCYVTSTEVGA